MSVILGLNAYHAGASAAILIDGQPVAAIAEERLNRVKYYARFPTLAIQKCLDIAGLRFKDIDYLAVGRDPKANDLQKLGYLLKNPTSLPDLLIVNAKRSVLNDLKAVLASECHVARRELRFKQINVEHHLAHTASAYFISPWERCAGFSIDGSGDFATVMLTRCEGTRIEIKQRVYVPHSLGSLYTMVCDFIGYRKYGDEGKVMGLAPYGEDAYAEDFDRMVELTDKAFKLNLRYFMPFGSEQGITYSDSGEMIINRQYSDYMVERFGAPREPGTELSKRDKDLAFGMQRVFEKAYMHLLHVLHDLVPEDNIAMAGGVVLNSVANGHVFDETPFRKTVIQPAAGDEGLALGAALYVSQSILKEKERYVMVDAYLGPDYSDAEIKSALDQNHVPYVQPGRDGLLQSTVSEIEAGSVVGWFQGKMEWGPRALGNRSILANPSLKNMKDVLNARIKRREWFRPFAPSILAERQAEIFEHDQPSPFMLHVYKIRPDWRDRLVAVNHVDNTGRLQTVAREENPLYYDLIKMYGEKTGVPVILNTSFNENEPIVCNPEEAVDCFLRTKMDVLVIGPFVCKKEISPSEPAAASG